MGDEAFKQIGRYVLADEIASGGIATVHFGRLIGAGGFSRTVAIKRLHPHFAGLELSTALIEEARLAARVRHPNVIATLDVVDEDDEVLLVMEYVHGEALSRLLLEARERGGRAPLRVAVAIVIGALQGLQAAHEARGEDGSPLGIIHRDVSPQNILVGVDGVTRVADFGVAKAAGRVQTTSAGRVKGKLAYMAPEQVLDGVLTPRTDVFAAGIVLWEALAGKRLLDSTHPHATVAKLLQPDFVPPSTHAPEVSPALDAVVMRALAREPADRWESALAFAAALEDACKDTPPATTRQVGAWVLEMRGPALAEQAARLATIERSLAKKYSSESALRIKTPSGTTHSVPRIAVAAPETVAPAPASERKPLPAPAPRSHTRTILAALGGTIMLAVVAGGARSGCRRPGPADSALTTSAAVGPAAAQPLKDAHFEE
ncbi:MAG: Protein kinase [Myxococcaceae bacterium]|nr:Protein kinase [Myxococcaceae bacterium]